MKTIVALLLAILLLAGFVFAQTKVPPRISPGPPIQTSSFDFQLVSSGHRDFRFDTMTGLTQVLTPLSNGKEKYAWTPILDQQMGAGGASGRYEVKLSGGHPGALIRLDRSTGRTWILLNSSILRWEIATLE